ncbi:MAG: adenosylcobinamide-phosphate synthase CbiB [Pseudanabaenaceae cyanobacterium SKYGB_i_bin29]|nr:adenosylcobinamide-phosphate synthase CbiB [Pseudanabaenaceae cyanobacterium SKYG29]MDW8420988.1 adenosylcobinamide-phosphate synthase CbiB [Pseudanabaenaceae cyanobacterium SKYGB_i_bin29]
MLILLAALLDYCLGDPIGWLHPVQVIGWVISLGTALTIDKTSQPRFSPRWMRVWGIVLALVVILGSGIIGGVICEGLAKIDSYWGDVGAVILLASCLAGRSLRRAAEEVLQVLTDLPEARRRLSNYVGRDTEHLDEKEILRAVMETVTENGVDGVTAPLFYALLGSFLFPPYGGVIFALSYKASSTLDSMIGYKTPPFTDLGWFSAKTEDCLTWLPCRLTVFTLALLSCRPLYVWRICQRDAVHDPSPNSGWSECVYAAILGVQLGGENRYKGLIKRKPLLGDNLQPITPTTISDALSLTRWCCLTWLLLWSLLLLLQGL